MKTNLLRLLIISTTLISVSSWASGGHGPKTESKPLAPAKRMSGSAPIDLSHGIPFNNGTFGLPNPEHTDWAKDPLLPGLSEKSYPYVKKNEFIRGIKESESFVQTAIWQWENTTAETKPEAVEYSKAAIAKLQPLLNQFRDAIRIAEAASGSEWDSAEKNARNALIELRATYQQLHRNVATH